MNILYTAFKGKNNSSKILLDNIISNNKLYLTNSFVTSKLELQEELRKNSYDLIVAFGQAPLDNNSIKIETTATGNQKYVTNYEYSTLRHILENDYNVIVSKDAGNYLCNNIYYVGLKYIYENSLNTKMIFIHIPKINKITDITKLSRIMNLDKI